MQCGPFYLEAQFECRIPISLRFNLILQVVNLVVPSSKTMSFIGTTHKRSLLIAILALAAMQLWPSFVSGIAPHCRAPIALLPYLLMVCTQAIFFPSHSKAFSFSNVFPTLCENWELYFLVMVYSYGVTFACVFLLSVLLVLLCLPPGVTGEVYCFPRYQLIFSFDRRVVYHLKGL